MTTNEKALQMHEQWNGKLETTAKAHVNSREDLAIAYTPGVAEPCKVIAKEQEAVYKYTMKANTVAVISDGSAVLGLGNIGAYAALPVMEGKAVLFKEFGQINAVPICLDTQDTEEIIKTIVNIAPAFGGINLEDISAPRCFEIEERLKELLDIPVFHDDQHGTSIAIINLREKGKMREIERIISKKFIVGEMPTAAGICQKQLIKVIDDLEKVKVNEEEIADFMPEIYRKLEWLSKEDLIKRMVSHEFNRFAEYYRNRPEIEQPTDMRAERAGRGDRKEGGFEKRSRKAAPGFNRLFINLGKTDSFFPSDLIGLLNSNTRGRIELGRIDLMQNYSFFEVPEKEATNVIKALNKAKWNGRKVVIEIAGEESGKGRESSSNERKGGKRFGGKSDERTPRYENKDRKPKDASAKGAKSAKKDKPSRAERGYSDARGPKKKDDWQEFFKDKEPDFSEEGWARRKPKK